MLSFYVLGCLWQTRKGKDEKPDNLGKTVVPCIYTYTYLVGKTEDSIVPLSFRFKFYSTYTV